MTPLLRDTLSHLARLVQFDTQNPPRALTTAGIFAYIQSQLTGFTCTLTDHGAGSVSLYAVRGQPRYLFNVHLDTVPSSPGWTRHPWRLHLEEDRAFGLGACDIKGAAAGLLAAIGQNSSAVALLFTSDEEANDARGVAAFLKQKIPYAAVIVAEPTQCQAVVAHRGISAVQMQFEGQAGHASQRQCQAASAVHQAIAWGARALQLAESMDQERFDRLTGLRFNIGRLEGGIKANVIAPHAELRFGFRPLPSMDTPSLLRQFAQCAQPPAKMIETFRGPSLPAGAGAQALGRRQAAQAAAEHLGLVVADAVDFWTEAALFSASGYVSFVYGPGNIAQAHAVDEFVRLDQLERYARTIDRMLGQHHADV